MPEPVSTADYRKYPKGPNFLLIVILFAASILIIGLLAVLVLHWDVRKLLPGGQPNPHPTSSISLPASTRRVA